MLRLFKEIFKKDFFENVGFVFTNWGRSARDKIQRKNQGISETKKVIDFNNELVKLGLRSMRDEYIPCFFLDNTLNEFDSIEELS